jgi:hypothetical protein
MEYLRRIPFEPPASLILPGVAHSTRRTDRRRTTMDKMETVALMAATIYAATPVGPAAADPDLYGRAAAQAWTLYDAVEKEAVERHARR